MRPSDEEVAQRVGAALNDADLGAMRELLDPDVQWGPPGADASWGCHNRDQVLAWFEQGRGAGVRADVTELVAGGGKLLVALRVRGRSTGRDADEDRWQVMTLREGRIVDIRGFERRQDAAAFAGLPQ